MLTPEIWSGTLPWIFGSNKGYMSGPSHGKVIRSNENFLTTRVMAELICAHESGKTEVGRVWRCCSREPMHAVPGDPWYVSVTLTTAD